MFKKLFPYAVIFLFLFFSFYFRINFWPLYERFGFYQGDIWYFYTYYGNLIASVPFYNFDYPVGYLLIQKVLWFLTGIIFRDVTYENFMYMHMAAIIPTALLLIYFTGQIAKKTMLKNGFIYFLTSSSFFVYSTINYDLFPVVLTAGALFFLFNKRFFLSYFLLAVAASIKLFPVFLFPLFLLYAFSLVGNFRNIFKGCLVFLAAYLTINLPYMLINFDTWVYPYKYQIENPERGDPTTLSYYLFHINGLDKYQFLLLLLLIFIPLILGIKYLIQRRMNEKNFILLIFITLVGLVLGNHVYTPQYSLWYFPVLTIVKIPPFYLWLPFDMLNAATRFFYFQLKGEYLYILKIIWAVTVFYYLLLYSYLLFYVKKIGKNN